MMLILFLPFLGVAQTSSNTISSAQILQSAWQSNAYQQREQQLAFLQNANLRLPLFEEVEARTETKAFEFDLQEQQEYTLRLQLNSPAQLRTQTAINREEINLRTLALNEALEQLLYDRYQLILELALAQQQQQHLQQQAAWFEDQEKVLRRTLEIDGERQLDDWLKLEDDLLFYQQAQLLNEQQLALLNTQLQTLLNTSPNDRPEDLATTLVPVEELLTTLDLAPASALPMKVQAQAVEVELLRLEALGELAEQNNLLQYFQLRYTGDDDPFIQDRLTLGAGVRLPFRNTNSVKRQYLELERLEEEHQQQDMLDEWVGELATAKAQLQSAIQLYEDLQLALANFQQQYEPLRLRDLGVTDVQVFLQAQGSIYQRQQLCLKQAKEVYQSYLEVLLLSGRITHTPFRNWLSSDKELLRQ